MMDGWTKKAPDGKTIVFKKEGGKDRGFVYTAEGRMVSCRDRADRKNG